METAINNQRIREQIQEKLELAEENERTDKPYDSILNEIDKLLKAIIPEEGGSMSYSSESSKFITKENYLKTVARIYYKGLRDYKKAEEYYKQLRDLHLPPEFVKNLGDCLRKQERHEEAITKYTFALFRDDLEPQLEISILNNKALSHMELSFSDPKELDSAKKTLEEAKKLEKDNVQVLCNLGKVYDLQKNFDLALETFEDAYKYNSAKVVRDEVGKMKKDYFEKILSKLIEFKKTLINKAEEASEIIEIEASSEASESTEEFEKNEIITTKNFKDPRHKRFLAKWLKQVVIQQTQAANELLDFENFAEDCTESEVAQVQSNSKAEIRDQEIKVIQEKLEVQEKLIIELFVLVKEKEVNIELINKKLEELDAIKLDNWEKRIDIKIQDKILQQEHKDYFKGFTKTFSLISTTSNVLCSGLMAVQPPTFKQKLLSTVLSMIPCLPPALANEITTIVSIFAFWQTTTMKTTARSITNLGTPSQLDQKASQAAFQIIMNENYKWKIKNVTDVDFKRFSKNIFGKIKNFCLELYDQLDEALYGKLYPTPAAKLGNRDANLLILKWLDNKISKNVSLQEEFVCIILQQKNPYGPLRELKNVENQENNENNQAN